LLLLINGMLRIVVLIILAICSKSIFGGGKDIFLAENAYGFSYQMGVPILPSGFKRNSGAVGQVGIHNAFAFHFIRNRPLRQIDVSLSYWQNTSRAKFSNMVIPKINNRVESGVYKDDIEGIGLLGSYTALNQLQYPKTVLNFGAGFNYITAHKEKFTLNNPSTDLSSNNLIFTINGSSKLGFVVKVEVGKEFEITNDVGMRINLFYQHGLHKALQEDGQSQFGVIVLKWLTYFVN